MTSQKYETHSRPQVSGNSSGFGTQPPTSARVTQEQREHWIAEAAYYMAEHRHFQGGDPVRDWLQAQMEIDGKIKAASSKNR